LISTRLRGTSAVRTGRSAGARRASVAALSKLQRASTSVDHPVRARPSGSRGRRRTSTGRRFRPALAAVRGDRWSPAAARTRAAVPPSGSATGWSSRRPRRELRQLPEVAGVGDHGVNCLKLVELIHRWFRLRVNRGLDRDPLGCGFRPGYLSAADRVNAINSASTEAPRYRLRQCGDPVQRAKDRPDAALTRAAFAPPESGHADHPTHKRRQALRASVGLGTGRCPRSCRRGGAAQAHRRMRREGLARADPARSGRGRGRGTAGEGIGQCPGNAGAQAWRRVGGVIGMARFWRREGRARQSGIGSVLGALHRIAALAQRYRGASVAGGVIALRDQLAER